MKNLILLSISLLFSSTFLFAQEDSKLKNEKKETIIKTTTVKGTEEKTTTTKTVKKEKQLIKKHNYEIFTYNYHHYSTTL